MLEPGFYTTLRGRSMPSPSDPEYGLASRDELGAYFDWVVGLFGEALAGEVLDHGAGTGILSQRLLARATRVVALEPDATQFERLRQRFATCSQLVAVNGDMESYLEEYGAGSLDAAVSSNVLEHLPDDVACLRQLHQALRPGGALAVFVPARAELFGSLDESVGHRRRYTRSLLQSRLEEAGFFVEWVRYGNLAGVLPWLISGRVLKQSAIQAPSLRVFDRWVLPVASRVEGWLRLPYGLNVAALARRQ
jgi:SAM-dependent methyltransferase